MYERMTEAFRRSRDAHAEVVRDEEKLKAMLLATIDPRELADSAYALREAENLCDDARKKLKALRELAEKLCCMVSIAADDPGPVRTDHVTATLLMRQNVQVPSRRRDPEAWRAMMRHLGVPDHLLGKLDNSEDDHAAVETHWPGLMNLIAQEQAAGKPLPPGVDPGKTTVNYSLGLRKKKGVTE